MQDERAMEEGDESYKQRQNTTNNGITILRHSTGPKKKRTKPNEDREKDGVVSPRKKKRAKLLAESNHEVRSKRARKMLKRRALKEKEKEKDGEEKSSNDSRHSRQIEHEEEEEEDMRRASVSAPAGTKSPAHPHVSNSDGKDKEKDSDVTIVSPETTQHIQISDKKVQKDKEKDEGKAGAEKEEIEKDKKGKEKEKEQKEKEKDKEETEKDEEKKGKEKEKEKEKEGTREVVKWEQKQPDENISQGSAIARAKLKMLTRELLFKMEKELSKEFFLQSILNDASARRVFDTYCRQRYCQESIMFWSDSEEYAMLTDREAMRLRAGEIYSRYLISGAPYELNLGHKTRETVRRNIEQVYCMPLNRDVLSTSRDALGLSTSSCSTHTSRTNSFINDNNTTNNNGSTDSIRITSGSVSTRPRLCSVSAPSATDIPDVFECVRREVFILMMHGVFAQFLCSDMYKEWKEHAGETTPTSPSPASSPGTPRVAQKSGNKEDASGGSGESKGRLRRLKQLFGKRPG